MFEFYRHALMVTTNPRKLLKIYQEIMRCRALRLMDKAELMISVDFTKMQGGML